MIHRALFGSFERFIAILIEHYAGAFPLWLAPVQAMVLAVADRHVEYGNQVVETLHASGPAGRDRRARRVDGPKDRRRRASAIPCILVVGDREVEAGTVSVRRRGEGNLGAMPLADLGERGRGHGQERF